MRTKHFLSQHYRFFLYLALIFLTNLFVVRIAFVYGSSMEPTLHTKEPILVWQLLYKPVKQDIVVTNMQNSFHQNLIKRVIATEGDHILITETGIYINDQLLNEPYLLEPPSYIPLELTVPKKCVFLMGDNRNNSGDSRDIGCIPYDDIIGKALFLPIR